VKAKAFHRVTISCIKLSPVESAISNDILYRMIFCINEKSAIAKRSKESIQDSYSISQIKIKVGLIKRIWK